MGNQSVIKEKEESCILAISQRGEVEEQYSNESANRRKQSRKVNKKVEEYPYNCIGMLTWENPSKGYRKQIGTGFLISPTIVVTAVHNVYDQLGNLHERMKFYPKLHSFLLSADSVSVIRAESVKKTQEKLQPKDQYCVLLLEKEVKRQKYLIMGYDYQLVENYNTEIFGYPLDLIEKEKVELQFGAKGKVARIQNGAIIYDIDTYNGQSGSPVLVQTSQHEKITVGIHCKSLNKEKLNCGCQFTKQNCEQIKGWVKLLTGMDVKTVCAGQLLYEVNPLAQYQRTKQEYRYITIAPDLFFSPNPEIPLLPKPMTKVQSSLDLWQTIKTGTFNINRYPFNCIGLIVGTYFDTKTKNHRKHYGTGFLISSKIVLTSIYNLIKFQDGCVTQYEDLFFYPQLHGEIDDPGNEVRTVKAKKYNIPNIRPTSEKELAETSLAMLELNESVKRKNYILIGQDYEDRDDAYLFGYGWDQLNQSLPSSATSFKQRGSEGKIIETARETIIHNAYSENGSQGSPLLVEYVQGFFFIVGIHIKNKYEGGAKNCLALQITANRVKTLNRWLKELKSKEKITSYNLKESKSLIKEDEQMVYAPIQLFKYYLSQLNKSSNKEHSKSEILIRLAQLNYEMGNYNASNQNLFAETQLKENFSYFKQSETSQVDYFSFTGLNSLHLRDFEAATKSFRQAQSLLKRHQRALLPQSKITLYNNIAVLHAQMKEYQKAQSYFELMYQEIKSSHTARIYTAIFLNNTSILYLSNNKISSVEFQAKMESAFGCVTAANNLNELLSLTKIIHNLSTYYLFTASYKRATEFLSTYLTTMRKLQLQTHPQYLLNLENMAQKILDFLRSDIVAKDVVLRVLKIMRKFSQGSGVCQQMMKELVWALQPDLVTAQS